jgi:hypothetical protein
MIPHDHHDDRETTVSPQALIRDRRAQDGALPKALRQQCLAAGAAMVPALIALLEAELTDDQAEPEGTLFHAVDLLGTLGDARAIPIPLRCLEPDDLFDGLALAAAAALRTLGSAALDGCLAAYDVFIELRAAIEELGGQLITAQHRKFEAADAERRGFVAPMHWDTDSPAASPCRTPPPAMSFAGPCPPRPAGTRKLGRNAPSWCGSGKKYKKCHLPLERR